MKALITKFDQTIYDKHKEEIFLQEEYDRQKLEFDKFMIEYNRVDAIYDVKVRRIEEEEKRLHEAKIVLFTLNRAAKKIQRWWKKYLRELKKQQKAAKGKGGKGGKGKGGKGEGEAKDDGKTKAATKGKKK